MVFSVDKHVRFVQSSNALVKLVTDCVFTAGKDVRLEQPRHDALTLVILLKSINGKDVKPEQPFHAPSTEVSDGFGTNDGKDVKLEQPSQAFCSDVIVDKFRDGTVVKPVHPFHVWFKFVRLELTPVNVKSVMPAQSIHANCKVVAEVISNDGKEPTRPVQLSHALENV